LPLVTEPINAYTYAIRNRNVYSINYYTKIPTAVASWTSHIQNLNENEHDVNGVFIYYCLGQNRS